MTSSRDDWQTPVPLFKELDAIFKFTLDASATPENTLCKKFLTLDSRYFYMSEFDALSENTDWTELSEGGSIWLNPPYGSRVLKFFEKVKREYDKGSTIVCLVPGRFETRWHKIAWDYARYFLFFDKRLKFELGGIPQGTATFPSELIIFSSRRWNLHSLQHLGKIIEQNIATQKELSTL